MLRTMSTLAAVRTGVSDGLARWCSWWEKGHSAVLPLWVVPAGRMGIIFNAGRGSLSLKMNVCPQTSHHTLGETFSFTS